MVSVFENYAKLNITDGVEITNQWNNVKNLMNNLMYLLYLLFSKCPKEVQDKVLDVFGLLTSIDEDSFRNFIIDLYEEYISKSKAFETKIIKIKKPFCPICEGNHWKCDCPNR